MTNVWFFVINLLFCFFVCLEDVDVIVFRWQLLLCLLYLFMCDIWILLAFVIISFSADYSPVSWMQRFLLCWILSFSLSLWCSGGHPAERHPSCSGHPWADEDPGRHREALMGEGTWSSSSAVTHNVLKAKRLNFTLRILRHCLRVWASWCFSLHMCWRGSAWFGSAVKCGTGLYFHYSWSTRSWLCS